MCENSDCGSTEIERCCSGWFSKPLYCWPCFLASDSTNERPMKTSKANPKCLNMGGLIGVCEIDELEAFIEGGFSDLSIQDISQDIRQTSTGNKIFI